MHGGVCSKRQGKDTRYPSTLARRVLFAATFNFRTNDEGTGYLITVVGYPATFENWKTADSSDLEWIRMEKTLTTNDREKISAVVK